MTLGDASDDRPAPSPAGASDAGLTNAAAAGREGLAAQLVALEAFVSRAESSGEPMPPAAVEMIARLREVVRALDGLTASLGDE